MTGYDIILIYRPATNQNLPPAPVQSPATPVPARAGRWAGGAGIRRAGPWRARRRTGRPAIPLHADHQVPTFIHAQQHLGHLSRAAGVFDGHPAAGAGVWHPTRPAALRAEHGHAHAVVPPVIASHPGIQRHTFIIHITHRLPSPRRSKSARRILTFRLCYHYATGKRCVPIEFGGGLC